MNKGLENSFDDDSPTWPCNVARYGILADLSSDFPRPPPSLGSFASGISFYEELSIAGWWLGHPSEKYEFVNWDDEQPNICKDKKNGNQTSNQDSFG